jgi:outer membrane murein-binding lipoprotein Lpp
MFRKTELVDSLDRDLARARNKRDTLASSITRLSTQIADLEVRLSAERIVEIKNRVKDRYLAFAPAIAGVRDATGAAAVHVPGVREFNETLDVIARDVAIAIDRLLGDLDQRIEAVRAGKAAPELPQSLTRSLEPPQKSDSASIRSLN